MILDGIISYLDEEYKNKICLNKSLIILVKTVTQWIILISIKCKQICILCSYSKRKK